MTNTTIAKIKLKTSATLENIATFIWYIAKNTEYKKVIQNTSCTKLYFTLFLKKDFASFLTNLFFTYFLLDINFNNKNKIAIITQRIISCELFPRNETSFEKSEYLC